MPRTANKNAKGWSRRYRGGELELKPKKKKRRFNPKWGTPKDEFCAAYETAKRTDPGNAPRKNHPKIDDADFILDCIVSDRLDIVKGKISQLKATEKKDAVTAKKVSGVLVKAATSGTPAWFGEGVLEFLERFGNTEGAMRVRNHLKGLEELADEQAAPLNYSEAGPGIQSVFAKFLLRGVAPAEAPAAAASVNETKAGKPAVTAGGGEAAKAASPEAEKKQAAKAKLSGLPAEIEAFARVTAIGDYGSAAGILKNLRETDPDSLACVDFGKLGRGCLTEWLKGERIGRKRGRPHPQSDWVAYAVPEAEKTVCARLEALAGYPAGWNEVRATLKATGSRQVEKFGLLLAVMAGKPEEMEKILETLAAKHAE